MYIRDILKRGSGHLLACQDSIYHHQTDDYIFVGVFDGCSEVIDSHFSSNLFKKTFKNEVEKKIKTLNNENLINDVAIEIMVDFFKKLNLIRIELNLIPDDFSSTCILFFYNKNFEKGITYVFGDGFLILNDKQIIIDHNNKPKYIVNFWKDLVNGEDILRDFLKTHEQIWEIDKIKNVVLSTDGIFSFKNDEFRDDDLLKILLEDTDINGKEMIHQNSFFEKKYNILTFLKWYHYDDLGLVRIVDK